MSGMENEDDLRQVYPSPVKAIREKALPQLDRHSRRFIELSPFVCLGSAGVDGLADVSPRGGEAGFVHALSDTVLALPDRPGNNRLDTLGNLLHSQGVGMLFFVPGVEEMLRVNGTGRIVTEPALLDRFIVDGKTPRSVLQVEIREVYLHCSKALRRSGLWNPKSWPDRSALPSFGQMIRDQYKTIVPAKVLDFFLQRDAKKNLY